MGWRFRKSFTVILGLRLSLSRMFLDCGFEAQRNRVRRVNLIRLGRCRIYFDSSSMIPAPAPVSVQFQRIPKGNQASHQEAR